MSEYTQLATADGQAEEIARLHREIEQLEASSEAAADASPLALRRMSSDAQDGGAAAAGKLSCVALSELQNTVIELGDEGHRLQEVFNQQLAATQELTNAAGAAYELVWWPYVHKAVYSLQTGACGLWGLFLTNFLGL